MPAESTPKTGSLRAAAASAIVPGLGQWLSGRRRAALLSALPLLVFIVVALGALLLFGVVRTAAAVATPGRLTLVVALLLLSIPWRILVTVDAARGAGRTRRSAILLALAEPLVPCQTEPGLVCSFFIPILHDITNWGTGRTSVHVANYL